MAHFAITTLWLTGLFLPALLFLVGNAFRRTWLTLIRAAIAIACGWAFVLSYALAANAINFSLPHTQVELAAMYDKDGAPLAFAAVLGWVLPTIVVFATWGIRSLVTRRMAAGA